MRDQQSYQILQSQLAAAHGEIRKKDDLIRNLRLRIEGLEAKAQSAPAPDMAKCRLELLKELDPLIKEKDARISELEERLKACDPEALAKQRASIREELEKEFHAESERRRLEIAQLRNEVSAKDARIAELTQQLEDKSQQASNLQTNVRIHAKKLFGRSAETINLLNGRDKEDIRAMEELSFDGKEVQGLSPEELERLNTYRESVRSKTDDDQVAARKNGALEELGVQPEPQRTAERRKPRPSSGLSRTTMARIKRELKETVGEGMNIQNIKFHLIDDEHPLPPGAQPMRRKDGTIDNNFSIVVSLLENQYEVHVYECERAKIDRDDVVITGEGGSNGLVLKGDTEYPLTRLSEKTYADPDNENITQENIELLLDKKVFTTLTGEPETHRKALNTCIFDNTCINYILREKYMYGSTFESIRERMMDGGVNIPKTTLNDNVHKVIDMLMKGLDTSFVERIREAKCLNIDETCVLVASPVDKMDDNGRTYIGTEYMKKYMWLFLDKERETSYYRYEEGSRARKVLLDVLGEDYSGTITTDGYSAYLIFDKDGAYNQVVLHTGCWVHARRLIVSMLLESFDKAMELIKLIRDLFVVEAIMKKAEMPLENRADYRKIQSIPIMNVIFQLAEEYKNDPVLMAGDRTSKAINYILNQRGPLQNFVLDGRAEISNNSAERLVKPIKRMLRNCLFMGSPAAASHHAFMFSLFETMKLMHIEPRMYLKVLLEALQCVPYTKPYNEELITKLIRRLAGPILPWNYKK